MIVDNPNFVAGNYPKGIAALSGLGKLLGMGLGATYTPRDCYGEDPFGTWTACVDENLRRQNVFFQEDYNERLASFIASCDRDWKLNDDQYKALNLPRPVNVCSQKTYGLTLPGTTGGQQQAQIPITYMDNTPAPVAAIPIPAPATATTSQPAPTAVPTPTPATQTQQQTDAGSNPGGSGAVTTMEMKLPDSLDFLTGEADILGMKIPYWLLGVGVAGGLYAMSKN